MQLEFNKFWKKLDNLQQTGILATSIITLSLFLSMSILNQKELFLLRSNAQINPTTPINENSTVDLLPESTELNIPNDSSETDRSLCQLNGGNWTIFPHSCANNCAFENNPTQVMCLDTETESCDCGPGSCWDGQACAPITPIE